MIFYYSLHVIEASMRQIIHLLSVFIGQNIYLRLNCFLNLAFKLKLTRFNVINNFIYKLIRVLYVEIIWMRYNVVNEQLCRLFVRDQLAVAENIIIPVNIFRSFELKLLTYFV